MSRTQQLESIKEIQDRLNASYFLSDTEEYDHALREAIVDNITQSNAIHKEAFNLVEGLNAEMHDTDDDTFEQDDMFQCTSSGDIVAILFLNQMIWNSDNDERAWSVDNEHEKEALSDFIRKESQHIFNIHVERMTRLIMHPSL